MQAIVTKYLGPSNAKGSRVKATCQGGSLTLHWDDSLNSDANHRAAALLLATRQKWDGVWIAGGLPDGTVAWVSDPMDTRDSFTVPRDSDAAEAQMVRAHKAGIAYASRPDATRTGADAIAGGLDPQQAETFLAGFLGATKRNKVRA